MCANPGRLHDGTVIACRKCWQCQERKIDDWVGRCIAENKTAVAAHSITLTYGRDEGGAEDHFRSAWLTYSDVQKFFKLLRFDGYKFRYLVAGEYGSMKGRAHWHGLIFWYPNNRKDGAVVPPHELTTVTARRFENKYWPHGFQHWEAPNAASIRYVCKYINKDQGKEERQGHLAMSKKPPLGDAYFRLLAQRYVDQGLAPQDARYAFPDVKDKNGLPKQFYMGGATARNFIEYYKAAWRCQRGGHHPNSTWIEEHDDKIERLTYMPPKDRWAIHVMPPEMGGEVKRGRDPLDGRERLFSETATFRWWYRKDGEEYKWQRGERLEKREPIMRMYGVPNPYEKAKHRGGPN